MTGASQAGCSGSNLVYENQFGCFDLNPGPGVPAIGRNFARGPSNVSLNLRLSRSWSFGKKSESALGDFGPPPGMGGGGAGNKYSLTLSASFRNILNHPNHGTPSGDLSSPYFGESRSLAGFGPMGAATTYNRKVDLQLRFTSNSVPRAGAGIPRSIERSHGVSTRRRFINTAHTGPALCRLPARVAGAAASAAT